jgi:malonyl-CoA/methylmalonyl-CoA synthetase
MMEKFDAKTVWQRFLAGKGLNLFMAVPTIYGMHILHWNLQSIARLIQEYDHMSPEDQKKATAACKALRLMVSGSAALPESIMNRWEQISGHKLLERYGMTEIGMALSNPLHGTRMPGTVGTPLPGVQARIIDDKNNQEVKPGESGELRIKGPSVFKE